MDLSWLTTGEEDDDLYEMEKFIRWAFGLWSFKFHKESNDMTKEIIKTILILNLRDDDDKSKYEETYFHYLPKEILFIIFEQLNLRNTK